MTETVALTAEMIWVLAILALTIFLFVSELVRVDVTAIISLLGVTGIVNGDVVFNGFASNAVISMIAIMIIGAGLDKTGVMNQVAQPTTKLAGNAESRLIALISTTVGTTSNFMQNIGAAALFLPTEMLTFYGQAAL